MENYNLITEVDILQESKDCFLTYAEEVLTDRAIPTAEDGLLSVQRKLLWTMEDYLKMDNKGKTKKSNSIVGATLSTAYFHGDASCYGALCKMAQKYLMRYPLIDGQGSLGTQEANGMQASSRYTEAKPSKYTDLMMTDFKKNVVPLVETYNGEFMEPVVLPSLFPNALANGREAIGISMSHNSLPNNLGEVCDGIVAYINNNDITLDEIMTYIKGPDFPLGGTVINIKDVKEAYRTGHSATSLKVRGDYIIEDNNIIFTSIPYRTYRNKIKEQIADNIEEFDAVLEDFSDESSVGINRLVFTVKKGVSHKTVLSKIFALTDLQTTLSYNMNFIVNGTPKLCSLIDLIKAYVFHQTNVLLSATAYDKEKAEARAHILRGIIIAVDKINEVIDLIKNSNNKDEARKKLINYLSIDDIQANAILDMKLSKLTKLDKEELKNELEEKEHIIEECNKIINNKEYRDTILIDKINDMKEKYADPRRTILENITESKEDKEIVNVEPEKCVVVMTESGLIKRVPSATFKTQKRNGVGIKTQDDITNCIIRTNTIDSLMIFTNLGKVYRLLVDNIPLGTNTTKGTPIQALVELEHGEEPTIIYSIYRDTDAKYVCFVTKEGMIKKTPLEDYTKTKKKTGMPAITLREGDELQSVFLIKDESIVIFTYDGYGIHFNSDEVSPTSRATVGVKGINLKEGDYVSFAMPVRDIKDSIALFSEKGLGKRIPIFEKQKRAGRGALCYNVSISSGRLEGGAMVNDTDKLLVVGDKKSICIEATELPNLAKLSIGNQVLKDSRFVSVSKV